MTWTEIEQKEIDLWNEKLKNTNASFFQYPYYAAGYRHFLFSKAIFLQLKQDDEIVGFCCILRIAFLRLKFGLIIRGPVFFSDNINTVSAVNALKTYALSKRYVFLRINPDDETIEMTLKNDSQFAQVDYFPMYKGSQAYDLIVYKRKEDELLRSFRDDCRNKIRFQKEMNYDYDIVKTEQELRRVFVLFKKLGEGKNFSYRPFKSYLEIFLNGIKHNLCAVYTASLEDEMICGAFIVKDGSTYTYFSGALVLGDIKPKYSPANNLHYLIMQDCFYKEDKLKYNLSYSAPGSGVHMFKTSFKPVEETKPLFYTYVIDNVWADRILNLQKGNMRQVRDRFRNLIHIFRK